MKKNKPTRIKYAIIASLVAVILLGGILGGIAVKAQVNGSFWDKVAQFTAQIIGQNVNDKLETSGILEQVSDTFGAMPGSDLPGPCFSVSGVTDCYYRVALTSGTSTPAYIKTPNATSTLVGYPSVYFNYASTSEALHIDIGKSTTTQYVTTTVMGMLELDAKAGGYLIGSSTATDISIFKPNTYIVVKMSQGAGGSNTGSVPSGVLQAVFRLIRPEGRM